VYAALADAAAMHYDEAALRQHAPLAEELAVRHGHTLYQAVTHRAWGVAHRLAGEFDNAQARLTQALALFRELGARWQIGRTLYELGKLAAAQGNANEARHCFTGALADFEAMGALPDVSRTQAALAGLG
jgi:tetratricopeptide (TPR) repeat protein